MRNTGFFYKDGSPVMEGDLVERKYKRPDPQVCEVVWNEQDGVFELRAKLSVLPLLNGKSLLKVGEMPKDKDLLYTFRGEIHKPEKEGEHGQY